MYHKSNSDWSHVCEVCDLAHRSSVLYNSYPQKMLVSDIPTYSVAWYSCSSVELTQLLTGYTYYIDSRYAIPNVISIYMYSVCIYIYYV